MRVDRVFILAATRKDALDWCAENGVQPYSKRTILVTGTSQAIRGHTVLSYDRVVILGHLPFAFKANVLPSFMFAPAHAEAVLAS